MSGENKPAWDAVKAVLVLILLTLALLLGKQDGKIIGREEIRHAAVAAGHAEYYLDANHNKQWRWKESK